MPEVKNHFIACSNNEMPKTHIIKKNFHRKKKSYGKKYTRSHQIRSFCISNVFPAISSEKIRKGKAQKVTLTWKGLGKAFRICQCHH